MQRMNKNKQAKLLAAIAVFAMVACAFAVVAPADPSDGVGEQNTPMPIVSGTSATEYSGAQEQDLNTMLQNGDVVIKTKQTINGPVTIPAGKSLFIGATADKNLNAAVVVTFEGGITVEGKLYNNLGNKQSNSGIAIAGGNFTVSGDGVFASTCAPNWTGVGERTYFFTSANVEVGDGYKQIHTGKISNLSAYVTDNHYSGMPTGASESRIHSYGDVTIDEAVTLADLKLMIGGVGGSDSKVTIEKGVTVAVDADGAIVNNGTLTNNGTITNEGTIVMNGTFNGTNKIENENGAKLQIPAGSDASDYVTADSKGTVSTTASDDENFGFKGELNSDYTTVEGDYLAGNLIIPEGKTLTVSGLFDMKGFDITVEGKLVITSKGSIVGDYADNAEDKSIIILSKTGVIENDGVIGKNTYVTVQDKDGKANVVMKNVKGVAFGLTKEIENKVTYKLTVSGEASKAGTDYFLGISGAYISDLVIKDLAKVKTSDENDTSVTYEYYVDILGATVLKDGSLTIGTKAAAEIEGLTLRNNATLTVDGEIKAVTPSPGLTNSFTVHMYNGSSAIINGNANGVVFQAKSGEYNTYGEGGNRVNVENDGVSTTRSTIALDNLKGIVIDVTSKTYGVYDDGEKKDVSKTLQMMNVAGAPAFIDKASEKGSITVTGEVYVATGDELVLAEGMSISATGDEDVVVANGKISIIEQGDSTFNFGGANYAMEYPKETSGTYTVNYYTTFDEAYANIATAVDKEITIKGDYEFSKEYTVAAGQTINFDKATIGIDGKITVEADGTLSNGFQIADSNATPKVPAGIKGTLVVMDGGVCKPVDKSYEVSSKDADNNYTYTSAERAIANAVAGETIYITNPVTFTENVTINEGVTIDVADTASITAQKDLTVNGKIVNEGTVSVAGNAYVNGEVDNNKTFTMTGTEEESISIKGTFTGGLTAEAINAAKYNNGEEDVYTSVAKAIEATATADVPIEVIILGKVTEAVDATLAEGQTMTVRGEVVLDSVRLSVMSRLVVEGTLTADVIGATGVEGTVGALADSVVALDKVTGIAFDLKKNESTSTVTMYMDKTGYATEDAKESITVSQGSVVANKAITVSENSTMKVASGAELVATMDVTSTGIDANKFQDYSKFLVNEGTLKVSKDLKISNVYIGGTLSVADNVKVTFGTVVFTGNIVSGKDAWFDVVDDATIVVGDVPTTLGATTSISGNFSLHQDSVVVVFDGSSFENTKADYEMGSTAYTINGIAFATAYTAKTTDIGITEMGFFVKTLDDLDVGSEIKWMAGDKQVTTDDKIGTYEAVSADIAYKGIKFDVSAAPGISVYIDDLAVDTTNPKTLDIGTHTITLYLKPGYEGELTATINGVKITDGKFEITTSMLENTGKNVIVVTGATPISTTPETSSGDDGMGITDYLLIVLVILIVIMAALVAVRMMRS